MKIIVNPERSSWDKLTVRAMQDDAIITERVRGILDRVREGGDEALRQITTEIDGAAPADFKVSSAEIDAACDTVSPDLRKAVRIAAARIRAFHERQLPEETVWDSGDGITCRRRFLPIDRVGLYIPGGSAPLFSTLLMLAIPARIAGCREIVLCTPCSREGRIAPEILYCASACGVTDIYKLGGAQAVGAMAYGTETLPKVHKIFGPGNRYVMKAKQMVATTGTAIDMPAGPSEVLVMADGSARPSFVASDLLSQAEHGPDSQVILVTDSEDFARRTSEEVTRQLAALPRAGIAEKALDNSRILVLGGRAAMTDFANAYAAEHLIIAMERPWEIADGIRAAGSVFIGNWSPESAGDYASGTNHTLPTRGLATAWSGIGTDSFLHAVTYQELSRSGLEQLSDTIITLAEAEGLEAHAAAVKTRLGSC